ncbi:hypothetical protein [Kribbella antiqua]|nr:hypothetical protein [Kribbella antiqua]
MSPTNAVPPKHVLRGTLEMLAVRHNPNYPENCRGYDEEGYSDIHVGQQVVVRDGGGQTVASGKLTGCQFTADGGMKFPFVVQDVPEADFIAVEIGAERRGQVTYSLRDLVTSGWHVNLSL